MYLLFVMDFLGFELFLCFDWFAICSFAAALVWVSWF